MPRGDEVTFLAPILDHLVPVPGVSGIALGGSRARGNPRPESDWDLALYVDDRFRPDQVRAVAAAAGWSGHVAELGEWGPVMNGGAWLQIPGPDGEPRKVDLIWRELLTIDQLIGDADRGEFRVVRIPFAVAGMPTYVPVGELSFGRALHGDVPGPVPMSDALRTRGGTWWRENATFDLDYAAMLAARDEVGLAVGLLARVLAELAHARQCDAGIWVLNEKGLLADTGLDHLGAALRAGDVPLADVVAAVRTAIGVA